MTSSRLKAARARAALYQAIRAHLIGAGYLEIETPALVPAPGMEPHITAFESAYVPEMGEVARRTLYLHTSPEYAMKRLLAEGFGSIFQICKVFRNGEVAEGHNPEFTMLEFYRSPGTMEALMDDLEALVRAAGEAVCPTAGAAVGAALDLGAPFERLTVHEAFERYTGASPPADEDAFFRAMLGHVEPRIGRERPTFLTEYPASMAALARLKPGRTDVAERFELYAFGVELANGFGELNDAVEQRRRLVAEQAQRRAARRPVYALDEHFLEAVGRMPDSAGVAVGLDRLLMVLLGTSRIADVLAFPAAEEWG